MSKSVTNGSGGNGTRRPASVPRAIIHKKILDAAASRPSATTTEIAAAVTGATIELVEQVLDEYGDPRATEPPAESTLGDREDGDPATASGDTRFEVPSVDELTAVERETLRAILETPDATQRELADRFGVAAATINERVNSLEGFDWDRREEYVRELFENDDAGGASRTRSDPSIPELSERVDGVTGRIDRLESRVEAVPASSPIENPELVAKAMRACLRSDEISQREEVELLTEFLR